MDFEVCAQCGREIEGLGILFQGRHFCSDECCEEFEELLLVNGEPDPGELELQGIEDLDEGLEDGLEADPDLDDLEDFDADLDLDDEF